MLRTMTAEQVKGRVRELGADLCQIASVERFADAPAGFHPNDIIKDCQSVIVVAGQFPVSTLLSSSPAAYTFVRNKLADKIDAITVQVAAELEELGGCAVPVPSADPYDYWDDDRQHGQGILSLKHAAVRAGLGRIGKNTLLINAQFGNMLWLGAIISDLELEPDALANYQTCLPNCRICLEACPAKALDGVTIEQNKCRSTAAKYTAGGGAVYACNLCRKVCPLHSGIKDYS